MKIRYEVKNLINVPQGYYLAITIPASFAMVDSAIDIFNARERLSARYPNFDVLINKTNCLVLDNVFYLIDRDKVRNTMSLDYLEYAFEDMRDYIISNNIKKVAMPKIGLKDNIEWKTIVNNLIEIFEDVDVEFVICVPKASMIEDAYDDCAVQVDTNNMETLSEKKMFTTKYTNEVTAEDVEEEDAEVSEFRHKAYKQFLTMGYRKEIAIKKADSITEAYALLKKYNKENRDYIK